MNLTLALNLNVEQEASLTKRAAACEPPLTVEAYLLRSLQAEISSYVEADFNAAAQRLIDTAKTLPFEERQALMAQVENTLASILP